MHQANNEPPEVNAGEREDRLPDDEEGARTEPDQPRGMGGREFKFKKYFKNRQYVCKLPPRQQQIPPP